MKIGFNLLLWTTNLVEEEFNLLEKLKRVGYDGVEIPVFGGETDVSHFAKIGKTLKDNGLDCTTVTVIPDEKRSPISTNIIHRNNSLDYFNNYNKDYKEVYYDNFLKFSSGCCMLVNLKLLKKKVGFFDKSFFLYNEEQDLVKRC